MFYYAVVVPGPFESLTYKSLHDVTSGSCVEVPLRQSKVLGVVWGRLEAVAPYKIRSINKVFDTYLIPSAYRAWVDDVAAYTTYPKGLLLMTILRALEGACGFFDVHRFTWRDFTIAPQTPLEKRLHRIITEQGSCSVEDITKRSIKELVYKRSLLVEHSCDWPGASLCSSFAHKIQLSPSQQQAYEEMRHVGTTALLGITGSGKTELYLAKVHDVLKAGGQALLLVPEIALTDALIERTAKVLNVPIYPWHADVDAKERARVLSHVLRPYPCVVIGARSAIFLPFARLRIIVVDEEHDGNYKQEEPPYYNARDMAVWRGATETRLLSDQGHDDHLSNERLRCDVLLVSATPSVNTVHQVLRGKYHSTCLDSRYFQTLLPRIECVFYKKSYEGSWLHPDITLMLESTLALGKQSMVMLNRRGYASYIFCNTCQKHSCCVHCSVGLVFHKALNGFLCHGCHGFYAQHHCASCQKVTPWRSKGLGIEQLYEEIHGRIPQARIALLTSDTLDRPTKRVAIFESVHRQEVDIILGTQIVSKGHHFARIAFAAMICESWAGGSDFRAYEKAHQTLWQMAGRAGREGHSGRFMVQLPCEPFGVRENSLLDHGVRLPLEASSEGGRGDAANNYRMLRLLIQPPFLNEGQKNIPYQAFYDQELSERKHHSLPPFVRHMSVNIASAFEDMAQRAAAEIYHFLCQQGLKHATFTMPTPAVVYRLRGLYRWRILVTSPRHFALQTIAKDIKYYVANPTSVFLPRGARPKSVYQACDFQKVSLYIDIDPYTLW